ncbi:hypothetical protein V2A60_002185 [Cordyceps javanica]
MQQEIKDICAQVLGRPTARMRMGKSFLAQGGDSLLAIKLVARCREAGYDISIANILRTSSIEELSKSATSHLDCSVGESPPATDTTAAAIERPSPLLSNDLVLDQIRSITKDPLKDVQTIFPCSRTQEVFLISQQANPEMYQCVVVAEITSTEPALPLDDDRLRNAWRCTVQRHPALRTLFVESVERPGHFEQVILKCETVPLELHSRGDRSQESISDIFSRHATLPQSKSMAGRAVVWKRSESSAVLRLEISHALMDGQSFGILFHDFAQAYHQNELPGLAPSFKYDEFVAYQEQLDRASIQAYWSKHLAGAEPTLFPTNSNRDFENMKQHRFRFELNEEALQKVGVEYNATAANLCQIAWALVLGSYVGSDDVCFSYVNSGRQAPISGIEDAVGAFVDVMICRMKLLETTLVSQALSKAKHDVIEGLSRPGSFLFEDEQQGQRISGLRGNTIMTFQMGMGSNKQLASPDLKILMLDEITASDYDISLNIQPFTGGLDIQLDYWQSRIDEEIMKGIAESFQTALACLIDKDMPLRDIDVVSKKFIQQLHERNSYTSTEVEGLLHDMVDHHAKHQPDALAVQAWDGDLTFQALNGEANNLAAHLQELGAQRDSMICTCFEKSKWAAISQLAVLKSGAAVVPLGTNMPMKRLELMIKDTGAKVILTTKSFASRFETLFHKVIVVDDEFKAAIPYSAPVSCSANSDSLAYIIYTSGSTGTPKGVMLTHGNLCISIRHSVQGHNPSPATRMLQFAAYTFDAAIHDFFFTWHVGGCVCITSEHDRVNRLVSAMCEYNVNWAFLTPTMAEMIAPDEVPSLEHLVLIGEAVKPGVVHRWINHVELWNGYGPSECSIISSCKLLTPGCDTLELGYPVTGAFWVVDATNSDRLVPEGAVGELLIEGPHLARGYLNDERKTSLSFITAPAWVSKYAFSAANRYYRTGDLVRQSTNGSVTFVGRRDTQVKLRGQRVEVAEIESHLKDHDAVIEAVIVLAAQGPCKGQLVALVALEGFMTQVLPVTTVSLIEQEQMARAKLQTAVLHDWLSDRVPEYMIPTTWIPVMSRLLQTESGKLDRVRLGHCVDAVDVTWLDAFASAGEELAKGLETTPLQSQIRNIWAEVLLLPLMKVPIDHRSFLSLGGDSITAMKAVSLARTQNITLTVPDILQSKSIVKLAEKIGAAQASTLHAAVASEPFPLSPSQQLYLDWTNSIDPSSASGYSQCHARSVCLQIKQKLDKEHVAASIDALVHLHPMLRARFINSANVWTQHVAAHNHDAYGFQVSHVCDLQEAHYIAESMERGLHIENGPVFSAQLMQFDAANSEQLLFVTGHQLVMDDTSLRIIIEDLEELLLQGPATFSAVERPTFRDWIRSIADSENEGSGTTLEPVSSAVETLMSEPLKNSSLRDAESKYEELKTEVIEFDEPDTLLFLGGANRALRTEPVELMVASLVASFAETFPSQYIPALLENFQGRHLNRDSMDNSKTVGSFSMKMPLHLPDAGTHNAVEILKQIKDTRRDIELRFCSRNSYSKGKLHNDSGPLDAAHEMMEILLNFDDSTHQMQKQSTLFSLQPLLTSQKLSAGLQVPGPSATIVDAKILQSRLHVKFHVHRSNNDMDAIRRWSREFHKAMRALVTDLLKTPSMLTLSDFPLIESTRQSVWTLENQILPSIGLQVQDVEDMYPCTPMQNGILMSQARSPGMYQTQMLWQLQSPNPSKRLNVENIMHAYQTLTNRHPMLRTVFIPRTSSAGDSAFEQIVLKHYAVDVSHKICDEDSTDALLPAMTSAAATDYGNNPNHKFVVYSTPSGLIYGHLIINHALSDGSSLALLEKELTDVYEERLASDIKAPPYSSYLSFLRQSSTEEALKYWVQSLDDAEACFLPAMTETNVQKEGKVEVAGPPAPVRRQLVTANVEDVESLRRFSERCSVTIANIFQLAWAIVLSKFVRSDDILFGYVSSGRDVPVHDVHQIFGPFVNILISRIKLDLDSNVSQSLQSVQKRFFENLSHQRTPLVDIWHALKTGSRGLFNTYLSYRQASSHGHSRRSLIQDTVALLGDSEYDAGIDIVTSTNGISVTLDYQPSFMNDDAATRLVDCLLQTVQSLTESETLSLRDVRVTTDKDIQRIRQWNSEIPVVSEQPSIHDTVYSQCCHDPMAKAVCAWDGDLTYTELDQLAEKLAFYLTYKLGVTPEAMVGVCFDKSRWAIVAQMAILKSGAAVVPVSPNDPGQRLEIILREGQVHTLLTSSHHAHRFEFISNVVTVDLASPFLQDAMPTERINNKVDPENAAFIIHTSGSTGNPKGVVLTHRSIASSIQAQGRIFELGPQTRTLQFVSYSFDLSITDIWGTLSHGGCVCVMSDEDRMNNIQGAIRSYEANFVVMTPTVANLLNVSKLPSLETLVIGGESLKPAFIEEHLKAPQLKIFNGYGPSECSMITTCNGPIKDKNDAPNIGRPMLGSVWLVDDTNNICPIGAVGEIWVEGPLVARGYLNKPEITEEAFPTGPPWAALVGLPGKRFYRTGDVARQNSRGDIFYIGRKDWQVKIRGNRVELGEIEHAIKAIWSGLQNVVACLISGNENSRGPLIATVLEQNHDAQGLQTDVEGLNFQKLSSGFQKELIQLKKRLSGVLPSHMIPSLFVPITRLPLTASGKVNRRMLGQSLESLSEQEILHYSLADVAKALPTSETEKNLRTLWAAVLPLEIDQVGVEDNFFHLGGDSYLAMRLVASTQADDSILEFTVSDVLQHPTIRELAQVVDKRTSSTRQLDTAVAPFSLWKEYREFCGGGQELRSAKDLLCEIATQCNLHIDDIEDIYPCTPLQEGLMVATAQQPRAYIARWAFQIPQHLDIVRFQSAWQTLGREAPILRTRIVPGRISGALQVVVRSACTWHTGDNLDQYVTDDIKKSMTYGTPLVRFAYIEGSDGQRNFIWTAHHSIYDGWSLPMIFEAVSRIYLSNELPKSLTPYSEFIRYLESQDAAEVAAFWRSELGETPGEPFPALPSSSYQPKAGQSMRCSIDLKPLKQSVTLASLLRAAWAATVSSHTGGTVLFAMPLSGRNAPVKGILDMMAPTVTTVPIQIKVDEKQSVHEYLAAVQRQASNMVPFEHSGLQHIRSMVGPDINPQHLFAIQSAMPHANAAFEGMLDMKQVTLPTDGFEDYALIVECFVESQEGAQVEIMARYDEEVLSQTQMSYLLGQFKHIFEQLGQISAADTGDNRPQLMGDIEYISPEEVARLATLNREVKGDTPGLLHELILNHSVDTPDKTAVCAWDGELSFRQLVQMSVVLASRLSNLGVTIESPVLLCCDKSKWVVVAILAILRAGGTVVPVKVDPVARLQAITTTTGATVVVTLTEFASQLQGIVEHIVSMDTTQETKTVTPESSVKQYPGPHNASFIQFTSGSTGTPKGIVLEHGSMSIAIRSLVKRFAVNESTRVFQFASLTFDMALHDILTPLIGGGCVCIPSEVERVNDLANAMRRFKANYSMLTPRVLHTIKPSECPDISTLLVGGERCDTEELRLWTSQAKVWHAYGPAECSIISTATEFKGIDPLCLGYMVPDVWISMAFMPQTPHHKADRRKLMDWVQSLDAEYFKRITVNKIEAAQKPKTKTEEQIQNVLADILGLPQEEVSMRRSFLSMGGDSITSMQVVSQCRSRYGISIHVRDILQSKSISQLALKAVADIAIAPLLLATDGEFRLSPIQRLFFRSFAAQGLRSEDEYRFNQSVCLIVNKHVDAAQLEHAARGVVSAHPMLRARFTKSGTRWKQKIEEDIDASCHVVFHQVEDHAEQQDVIWAGQRSLNIEGGPVFSVHCIEVTATGSQLLFLVAHHLVVDIVSWQIILRDLDNLIQYPQLPVPVESTTFQHWLQLQNNRAQDLDSSQQLIHDHAPMADWSYWGVTPDNNTYGDRINEHFTLEDCTSVLFSESSPLRSEPVEILLAALFHSFHQVFPDRAVPTVFNEGHGREPWSDAIDLSNTVGWFTTMTPIHVPVETNDVIDVLKRTKDLRRSIPDHGFSYFTSRFLTRDGQQKFASHDQPEIMFNFGGRYRDDKYSRSLLRMSNDFNSPQISGIGNKVKRIAVFEVEASIHQDNLILTLGFNKNMQDPDRISRWAQAYRSSLQDLLHQLSVLPPMLSLADVPLLSTTYDELDRLQSERLAPFGIRSIDCIEDIYHCSPAQDSILRSQAKDSSTFHVDLTCEFRARDAAAVNLQTLVKAWQLVVSRHTILRTVFVPPVSDGNSFYQVVLKQYEPEVTIVHCETIEDIKHAFKDDSKPRYPESKPEHQLTLYASSNGQVFLQLRINHTLVDVSSLQLIMNEITLAYEDGALDMPAPSFSKYIGFLQESSVTKSTEYWTARLAGAEPRCLPVLATSPADNQALENAHLEMGNLEPLHRFRDNYGITIANILQMAWAFVLAKHSGSSDVLFGYVANGRDAPVDDVSQMVGPLINMMVSRISFRDRQLSVAQTADQVQNDFMEAFKYQRVSLKDIQHATGLSEQQMLHSVVSIVRDPGSRQSDDVGISVQGQSASSLADYDVSLNAACGERAIKLSLQYSPRYRGSVPAKLLLENLQQAIFDLVANGEAAIGEVELSSHW